ATNVRPTRSIDGLPLTTKAARRAVHRRLERLDHGLLAVHDGAGSTTFGRVSPMAPDHAVSMRIGDANAYRRMVTGGSIGFAEGYLAGEWDSDDLVGLLRLFTRNIAMTHEASGGLSIAASAARRLWHRARSNSRRGSRRNIEAHYDLGNDLFELFLDPTMTYSCGIFRTPEASMEEASVEKLDRICRKLDLSEDDHVVEIGTGWGSFAIHAARTTGCRVTTTTISPSQHALASARVREAGLEDRVRVLLKDYRDLEGTYDALVSIEMIEAVGHRHLDSYFGACSRLLKDEGSMVIQAISVPDRRYASYLRSVDYIQRHVFPGSCCPSVGAMMSSVGRSSDLKLVHLEDLTPHYATTLSRWRARFQERIEEVRALGYPARFERMWTYYLAYCEAGFAERYIGTAQVQFDKPACRRGALLPPLGAGVAEASC
ncbi:MAG: class I SAM-dependent methyltransferase, partial [Phycisphaerales bacterium]|nr:class I SAM-dependent methyltransferase [Phycisphaerales bacterium]